MNSTKKPLYKKEVPRCPSALPKNKGGAGSALCPPPPPHTPWGSPVPTPTPLARKKGGEGLPGTVGDPSPQHFWGDTMARAGSPGTIRPGDPLGSCKRGKGGPRDRHPQPGRHKHVVKRGLGQRMLCPLSPPPAPKRCFNPCRHTEGGEASMWGQRIPGGEAHGSCRSLPQPRHGSVGHLRAKSPGLDALGFGVGAGGALLQPPPALRQAAPEGPSQARAPQGGGDTHAAGPGCGQEFWGGDAGGAGGALSHEQAA